MSYLKPRNLLLVLAFVLALVLVVVILMRYRPEGQLQNVVSTLPKGIDVSLEDIDYTHIEGGVARWRLVASEVERTAESKVMTVSLPALEFFNEHGVTDGKLRAAGGEISEDYKNVLLTGDVVLKSSAGYTLYTERLRYDHEARAATTDALVRMVAEGMTMKGVGMHYRVPDRHMVLKSEVEGVFDVD